MVNNLPHLLLAGAVMASPPTQCNFEPEDAWRGRRAGRYGEPDGPPAASIHPFSYRYRQHRFAAGSFPKGMTAAKRFVPFAPVADPFRGIPRAHECRLS